MLNQELDTDSQEMEQLISELAERGEMACTGNGCGAQAEGL